MAGNSNDLTPPDETGRLDATGEFFSVGAPLHAVRAGYVRRRADEVLYETLVAGRYAHVIAPEHTGKSSLIAATAARLEANGVKIAILDLEQIGVRDAGTDAGRWYYSVAYRLLRQLRIRIDLQSWWQDKAILSNRQRLVEFYSEVVLQNVPEQIVVFIDEIQCIEELQFGDQLLASIRAAHNARATDPEFSRLTFVLLGECDPLSLIGEPELSPFNVTQAVTLTDFSRDDLDLFATELNLSPADAAIALDRIYYWTGGQPYLTQKLARSVAREQLRSDIEANIDRIVILQLAGRSALHNEPHMSHIHRKIVKNEQLSEPLLNLYGRISKGIDVDADLGSPVQRRLIAIGLVVIDVEGNLRIRNRIYRRVFTARWANENLPIRWGAPAIATAIMLVIIAIPFWYTQLLPNPYVEILTSPSVDLATAEDAYTNLGSFPGHLDIATSLYRRFLENRAAVAANETEIAEIAKRAAEIPGSGRLADSLKAGFWDRRVAAATRAERRDEALLASLQALVLSTPQRRNRAAALVDGDYPLLLASLPASDRGDIRFNPRSMLLTEIQGARVLQWALADQSLERREDWAMTALEVTPLVRRVVVDQDGNLRRIGLTLKLSHARFADLRIKLIAPSGRTVEIESGVERASANEDLRIPAAQLRELLGEPQTGTWSLSLRDEATGVAGQLVGWNLQLNSQVLVEEFERGLNIPDPLETEADRAWVSADSGYAVAQTTRSDNARIWDLAFAKPVRAIAVSENERLIGLSAGARHLVTATQDTANLWDSATGDRVATLAIGPGSSGLKLTGDGQHLFVERRGDVDTRLELWLLESATVDAVLEIAGTPALVAFDKTGERIAIADYDRAVRIWDFHTGNLITQVDLDAQPSEIQLAPAGDLLGVVFGNEGAALWRIDRPERPVVEDRGRGHWQLAFSPSGTSALIGRPHTGFQLYRTSDGRAFGAPLGAGGRSDRPSLLGFSADEQTIVTGGPDSVARFWRAPPAPAAGDTNISEAMRAIWPASGDAVAAVTPDGRAVAIGDRSGDVHILPTGAGPETLASLAEDVGFLGHSRKIRRLAVSPDSAMVVSAAEDNTVRVWSTSDGRPREFFGEIPGNAIDQLTFSPDGTRVGIVNGNLAHVMDARSGEVVASVDLGEANAGLTFGDSEHLYVGGDSGTLRVITRELAE
ncbi:MAG: AAA-like domain-containing protein, partial [Gammaproteobacteria bacterium]|nr:AAA-like domain-containing protein [Gammaproteobacteria bacterium]